MKRLIGITFLLCVTFGPLYQLGLSAYYFFNLEQLIVRYCVNKEQPMANCNAKCYLSEQLAVIDNPEEPGDQRGSATVIVFFPLYFESLKTGWDLFPPASEKSFSGGVALHYCSLTLKVPIPPPKV